jgi:hypothetical protein
MQLPEKEEIPESLVNQIEVYIQDVIKNKDLCLDITDSPIGCAGAEYVALAIPLCESAIEMRLPNCNIKDEGIQILFESLR